MVELFMLFGILLMVIVVITQILVLTRGQSLDAKHLTKAVIAAENTAEVTAAAEDADDAAELLAGVKNADNIKVEKDEVALTLTYGKDSYPVRVAVQGSDTKTGRYTAYTIKVYLPDSDEEMYKLESGHYAKSRGGKEAA